MLAEYQSCEPNPIGELDRLTALAARMLNAPIALISLVDRDRQVFPSHHGLDICETNRQVSFCAHAIDSDDIIEIPDALSDPRFHPIRLS